MKAPIILLLMSVITAGAQTGKQLPVIDMHLHAYGSNDQGPSPLEIGAPFADFSSNDPKQPYDGTYIAAMKTGSWNRFSVRSPTTDDSLRDLSLAILVKRNIFAVCSGDVARVRDWKSKAPDRIIEAVAWDLNEVSRQHLDADSLRRLFRSGEFRVFGEIGLQYQGIGPADTAFEPYLKLAEELDIPVGIHIGPGPPGAQQLGFDNYRARLHDPLLLEPVLVKHPRLRVYAMHAGWPMIDNMLAMLYAYPQLYVDIGVIDYILPKKEFDFYLGRLVNAGFGKRVMYGSDQMVWPGAIEVSLNNIEKAAYLTLSQKRDILFNNAARFLRLTEGDLHRINSGSR